MFCICPDRTPHVNSLQKKASFCLLSHQSQDFDDGRNCNIAKPGRDSHSEPEGIKEKIENNCVQLGFK